jgi:hypothetical protein
VVNMILAISDSLSFALDALAIRGYSFACNYHAERVDRRLAGSKSQILRPPDRRGSAPYFVDCSSPAVRRGSCLDYEEVVWRRIYCATLRARLAAALVRLSRISAIGQAISFLKN